MKKIISAILGSLLVLNLMTTAFATTAEEYKSNMEYAASILNTDGFVDGVGTDKDGLTDYDIDGALTREQAITLIVRLTGKYSETENYNCKFTDVSDWAKGYVGFAYENGITKGISETQFGAKDQVTSNQFISFILRLLNYEDGVDFNWWEAYILSDKLGITKTPDPIATPDYSKGGLGKDGLFLRGDSFLVMYKLLNNNNGSVKLKNSDLSINKYILDNRTRDLGYTFEINEKNDAIIYMKDMNYDAFIEAIDKSISSGASGFDIGFETDYAYGVYVDMGYYYALEDYIKKYPVNYPNSNRYISMYGKSGGLTNSMENTRFVIWGNISERTPR